MDRLDRQTDTCMSGYDSETSSLQDSLSGAIHSQITLFSAKEMFVP